VHSPDDDTVLFQTQELWQLYDLEADPGELDDRAEDEAERLERMRSSLEERRAALQRLGESLGAFGEGDLDETTRAQLRELGYGD